MKKKLLIILAVIFTLILLSTGLTSTVYGYGWVEKSNSLEPMIHYSLCGEGEHQCACGPSSGTSIGIYYRERDRNGDGSPDYPYLPTQCIGQIEDYCYDEIYDALYDHMNSIGAYTNPSNYGPGFVEMTREFGYYNFGYSYDSTVTHDDFWDIVNAIDYGWPVALGGSFPEEGLISTDAEDPDNWPPIWGHYIAIKGYSYEEFEWFGFKFYINRHIICTDSLSGADNLTLDWDIVINEGTGFYRIKIFDFIGPVIAEEFEWGADGSSLSNSGGEVTWNEVTSAEIDTAQKWGGTRSGKWYWDGAHAAEASFTCAPVQSFEFRYRQDGGNLAVVRHGDETHRIDLGIFWNGAIKYWDTQWRDTGYSISNNLWYRLQIKNIDWTTHKFDIYLNSNPIKTGASMQAYGGSDGIMYFINAGSHSFWIDNIACEWR